MEIPLPGELRCELIMKAERPLERCHDKGVALSFDISVSEGYDVLRAKVKSAFATKERLAWNDGLDVYIRLAKNAPQKAFVKIDQDGFMPLLQTAWRNARLRRGGHVDFGLDLFVYVEKPKRAPTATLHRTTEKRVQQVIPRVQEALQEANVSFGPATLPYAATAQARLPNGEDVRVPDNTTFQQLQHIDSLEQAPIQIILNEATLTVRTRVEDSRHALGLPLYPLYPPFRPASVIVPPPNKIWKTLIMHSVTMDLNKLFVESIPDVIVHLGTFP
ncbi:hypothetical protein F443_14502 [Phytophthora nicotianae P1569]|uniref:Uncharacterized protein n=1 Tax=Phytophthora nicotianae P1569 TaxID=1317065 RepID=V9EL59_PHYNI|nr:hypothetical protein F443_14502 [Phytophthora nicotianae P1569]